MMMESVFQNLVEGWDKAMEMDSAMSKAGYKMNPYFEIAACIAEAIYHMIDTEINYENSITCNVLHSDSMSLEERAYALAEAYNKRR